MTTILYSVILTLSLLSGRLSLSYEQKNSTKRLRFPKLTAAFCIVLGICYTLQLFYPQLLIHLRRDTTLILSGEYWRMITALFVQDGGTIGAIYNIFALLLIGGLAEQYLKKSTWVIIFFAGGILSNCIALLWQPIGAGNSVANFALAGATLLIAILSKNNTTRVIGALGFLCAAPLLVIKDIHGAAVLIGAILYLISRHYLSSSNTPH